MNTTTRAAVLDATGGRHTVQPIELDPPRAGEVLVRLAASGVCHSDLHQADGAIPGPLPVVLGHEGAGIVEALGPGVEHLAVGDPVVLSWIPYCGACACCASGRFNLCTEVGWADEGVMRDGTTRLHRGDERIHHCVASSTFSEWAVVPAVSAVKVGADVPLVEASLLGCAVMTGVGAVQKTANVRPGQSVAVIGCGGVGLSVIMGATLVGAGTIVAIDPLEANRALATELGATVVIDPTSPHDQDRLREVLPAGADHVFEAIGKRETIEQAVRLLARGGTATLVGMAAPGVRVEIDPLELLINEQSLLTSWYGGCQPAADIPRLATLLAQGRLPVAKLITTRTIEEIDDVLDAMRAGTVVGRNVIVFDSADD